MSLRNKIFLRISLLLFLLILAICITGSFVEIGHRRDDTLHMMQARVTANAASMATFVDPDKQDHLKHLLVRVSKLHPSVLVAFIEQSNELHLSSSTQKLSSLFFEQRNDSSSKLQTVAFQEENGTDLIDISSRIGPDSPYILHTVLVKDALATGEMPAVKVIVGFGVLAFIFSTVLALVIANRTSREVNLLTRKLSDYGDQLEMVVEGNTGALQRFERIVSATTDFMSFVDSNYIYREINSSYLTAFNKSREEVIGSTVAEIFGIEIFESKIKENFDRCLKGELVAFQSWFDFPGLGRCLLDVSYIPYKEDDGTISGVVISAHDVSNILHAEERLHESEERFRSLFDGVSIGIAIYTPVNDGEDFVFLAYNKAGMKMDGITDDVIGQKVSSVFPAIEKFGLMDVLRRVFKSGIPEEHPISIYEGREISFWRHNAIFKLPSGELVAVYTDETDRMKAEESLRTQHANFVAVLDSLDAIVYVADMQTHEILFANKSIRDEFGDCAGKICWQTIQVDQTGPCEFCTNARLLDETGKPTGPYVWEFQNTTNNQWYQCRDQAINWPDGRLVRLEIATNITNRKMAEEADRLQGKFLRSLGDARQVLLKTSESVPYQDFLNSVGPAANAGRAYLLLNNQHNGGQLLSLKAAWSAESSTPLAEDNSMHNIPYEQWMPNWQEMLNCGKSITLIREEISSAEGSVFEDHGLQSIALVPIMIDGNFAGVLGFENCISRPIWSEMGKAYFEALSFNLAQAIKRSRSERKVRESLKEKEVLLREIHHRVKNNMQVVTSLLSLQARKITDDQALEAIRESQDRIQVMSLVHETLYRSDDLQSITMKGYFQRLVDDISRLHAIADRGIECIVEAEEVTLTINDAIPIGLIANELLTNACKHAFADDCQGKVRIALINRDDGELELIVSDNGRGIPEDIDPLQTNTLGLQLVSRLAKGQLGGTLELVRGNGTAFHVRFSSSSGSNQE